MLIGDVHQEKKKSESADKTEDDDLDSDDSSHDADTMQAEDFAIEEGSAAVAGDMFGEVSAAAGDNYERLTQLDGSSETRFSSASAADSNSSARIPSHSVQLQHDQQVVSFSYCVVYICFKYMSRLTAVGCCCHSTCVLACKAKPENGFCELCNMHFFTFNILYWSGWVYSLLFVSATVGWVQLRTFHVTP